MLVVPRNYPKNLRRDNRTTGETSEEENKEEPERIDANGYYSTPEDVALYIYTYRLPQNYITKGEAQMLGWKSSRGNLWDVTDRMIIGGDRFYNREGLLPNKSGRLYYECDVNYYGGYRGSERLVYSNDGLITTRRMLSIVYFALW